MNKEQKRQLKILELAQNGGTDKELTILESINDLEDKIDETVERLTKEVDEKTSIISKTELIKIKGDKGEKGDKGDKGDDGRNGIDGKNGVDGKDGKDGINGKDGKNGKDGTDGKDGINGKDGKDGINGSPDTPQDIINKINSTKDSISPDTIKGFRDVERIAKANSAQLYTGVTETRVRELIRATPSTGGVQSVVAGTNVSVDNTDPLNPIVSATTGSGGITRTVTSISADTTAGSTASTDYVYFVSGTTTLTLPTAVGNTNRYTVKSITGTTVVACNGIETIDGTATIGIANEDSVDLISNNTEWKVV